MLEFADQALAFLKARQYRITRPRRLILEILARASEPVSAHEVHQALAKAGEHIDPVSVYRTLTCLEENGLAHRVLGTGRFRRCELQPEDLCQQEQLDHCHHNLICRSCGSIEELHCPGLQTMTRAVANLTGFLIEGHDLEFRGLCRTCDQNR